MNINPNIGVIDQNADVVFVGGGPVGLWTAIQTQVRTGKKVVVLEKYAEYQRADIRLSLDHSWFTSSFSGMADDAGLKDLVADWKNKKVVPIKEMEEGLVKRANELGITILRGHNAKPADLPQQFPNAKVIVGADGARSEVRKQIFEDKFSFNATHQYLVQVQYNIEQLPIDDPDARSINPSAKITKKLINDYKAEKYAGHLITETIRKQEDGTGKVTLQIFVGKETYDKMTDATFRNPYYLESDLEKIPDELKTTLKRWWGARETHAGQVIKPAGNANKMTVIALGSYAAQDMVKEKDGKVWALVGDAAAAFPFFRAINNGLYSGTDLSKKIAQAFEQHAKKPEEAFPVKPLKSYAWNAKVRAQWERFKAFFKSMFISLSSMWVKVSNYSPIIKHGYATKNNIDSTGERIWQRLTTANAV